MSRGINKVIIIGNLGSNPDVKHMPNGTIITNISIATSSTWKDKQSGDQEERTEWHRVVLYNKFAEIAEKFLKKGAKIYIEGSLRTSKWQDKNNNDRYTTEIICNHMQMLDTKLNKNIDSNNNDNNNDNNKKNNITNTKTQDNKNTFNDEIPF